jgi:hypothetical protein
VGLHALLRCEGEDGLLGTLFYRPVQAIVPDGVPIHILNPTSSPHTLTHEGCRMSGLEQLRRHSTFSPVIVMSSDIHRSELQQAILSRAMNFFIKPLTQDELTSKMFAPFPISQGEGKMKLQPQKEHARGYDRVHIPPGLPPSDIVRIQRSFQRIAPQVEQFVCRLYAVLFERFPELRMFFHSSNFS